VLGDKAAVEYKIDDENCGIKDPFVED